MSKHTIVILQDNVRKAESLAEEFEKSGDFTVVGLSSDGEEGAGLILSTQCEYCVTDLILQSLDGLGVLDRVRKAGCENAYDSLQFAFRRRGCGNEHTKGRGLLRNQTLSRGNAR